MRYSLVIPVYNEEGCLLSLQEGLSRVMEPLGSDYEIIYVDDGSKDNSLKVLKDLKDKYPKIKIISFTKNQGQSAAFLAGFRLAEGEWLITLDGDGQNPPEEIPKLLRYTSDFDFITGVRKKRLDPWQRRISSQIARFFRWLVLRDTTLDTGCSLRVFKKEILKELPFFKNFHRFFTFLVRQQGFKIKEVEVEHRGRFRGTSKYTNLRRLKEGLLDLGGVFWLKRRLIKFSIKYEA